MSKLNLSVRCGIAPVTKGAHVTRATRVTLVLGDKVVAEKFVGGVWTVAEATKEFKRNSKSFALKGELTHQQHLLMVA